MLSSEKSVRCDKYAYITNKLNGSCMFTTTPNITQLLKCDKKSPTQITELQTPAPCCFVLSPMKHLRFPSNFFKMLKFDCLLLHIKCVTADLPTADFANYDTSSAGGYQVSLITHTSYFSFIGNLKRYNPNIDLLLYSLFIV